MSAYHEGSFEPHSRTVQKEEEICARQGIQSGCRDPEVYLLRRKMDKRRKRATRFYSHVTHSIHRPNPTPCASAVRLMQTQEDDYDPGEGEGDDQT
ncbi:hypothetical protein NC652_022823 [Populus alba x Populus x berolinensis]|nr:hypothetical protein NC652_022823 [Populus alba x Populus x berolinensis]